MCVCVSVCDVLLWKIIKSLMAEPLSCTSDMPVFEIQIINAENAIVGNTQYEGHHSPKTLIRIAIILLTSQFCVLTVTQTCIVSFQTHLWLQISVSYYVKDCVSPNRWCDVGHCWRFLDKIKQPSSFCSWVDMSFELQFGQKLQRISPATQLGASKKSDIFLADEGMVVKVIHASQYVCGLSNLVTGKRKTEDQC